MATLAPASPRLRTYTRRADGDLELPYEKPVIVPALDEQAASVHAWVDARFWADIMSEHAYFLALLMPEELAAQQRAEALTFSASFAELHRRIDADGAPRPSDVGTFSRNVAEQVKPFIDELKRAA